ncbi:TniQ family protein [Kribbella sp. NPDC051718]|uniref:TniQ family protein n=1 Tax=Kribbella sp. NPDC051718 TaxID=3155168 RepID=UPI0034192934
MTAPPARWPLHPPPGQLESLSSWLDRLAVLYGMTASDLVGERNLELGGVTVPHDLDFDPPWTMLLALAQRTGIALGQLQAMTLSGWALYLFDTPGLPRPGQQQHVFVNYVRSNTVLLALGEAGHNQVGDPRRWNGPWRPTHRLTRQCPVCAADPGRGSSLMWQLSAMVSCGEHGCYLEDRRQVTLHMLTHQQPMPPRSVPEPLATLERYTHTALTTGCVDLPGRQVHAAVWLRLLRSLLDEVSLALSTRRTEARTTLQKVWAATGLPERGGLNVWQVYERLEPELQHWMLRAAAAALDLAAKGEITACGRLGSAIQPHRRQYVYDGDRPAAPTARQEAVADAEVLMVQARTDHRVARQLLVWLTASCPSLAQFEQQRAYLFGAGIPAAFLPGPAGLGRDDLV